MLAALQRHEAERPRPWGPPVDDDNDFERFCVWLLRNTGIVRGSLDDAQFNRLYRAFDTAFK
jgi:hypothetical protein